MTTFRAVYVTQAEDSKQVKVAMEQLERSALVPGGALAAGDVLIRVAYSTLNYKDGLAVTGRPGVVRKFPMIPGIDFAGTIEESNAPSLAAGDRVVVTGCGTGETIWGGFAELARIDAQYAIPLPKGISLKQAMGIGTAGFTAMQAAIALERHGLVPGEREVLVTGASGGVGSVAIAILAKLGYSVAAATGRPGNRDYLTKLGAASIVDRAELEAPSKRPLDSERWAAAIDTVGGPILAGVLRSVATRGSVAVCGLAGEASLNTTVFPFILRGVNLLGIDSPKATREERLEIWQRLERDLPLDLLDSMVEEIELEQVFEAGERIIQGQVRGRTVVRIG